MWPKNAAPPKDYEVYFFEGSRFLGRGILTSTTGYIPSSYAYVCPRCGELWARGAVTDPDTHHAPLAIPCPAHDNPVPLGQRALFFFTGDEEYTDSFPKEVLVRDFLFLYQQKEKQ